MRHRLVPVVAAGLLLTACASSLPEPNVFSELDQVSAPELPDHIDVDSDSFRLVAEIDGVDYYAATTPDHEMSCLLMVAGADPDSTVAGCTQGTWVRVDSPATGAATLHVLGDSEDTGTVAGEFVSEWLEINVPPDS